MIARRNFPQQPFQRLAVTIFRVEETWRRDCIKVETAPKSMSLESSSFSGLLQVLTPAHTIDMLKTTQARAPVEQVMLTMPPGVPFAQFARHVELFAKQAMPAFR